MPEKKTKKKKLKVTRERVSNLQNTGGGNKVGDFFKDFGKSFVASFKDTLNSGSNLWKSKL